MSGSERMTCEEAFRRLDDFLDRQLTPDETRLVAEHLDVCAVCAREFKFEGGVLDGVRRKLRRLDVPEDLLTRILSRLPRQPGSGTGS